MKLSILVAATSVALVSALPQSGAEDPHKWIAGGKNDFRGPCPMMNTLANHGFLPRDGRNITRDNAIAALGNGLNFDSNLAGIMWEQAIFINPEPNATFFTLDQLNVHNILEHDGSLSRLDAFFGNNHVFNQKVFDTSRKWWTDRTITAKQLAHSKIYRQLESRSSNPNYTFTASVEEFSLGEVAAPIIVFGNMTAGTVRRDLVKFFFVRNATSLITGGSAPAPHKRAIDLHGGIITVQPKLESQHYQITHRINKEKEWFRTFGSLDMNISVPTDHSYSASGDYKMTSESPQSSDARTVNDRAHTMAGPVPSRSPKKKCEALPKPLHTPLATKEKQKQTTGLNRAKLSKEAQDLCAILDETLGRMMEVHERMTNFQAYIHSQKQQNKPLYQWTKYDGYRILGHAVSTLDEAASKLESITEEHSRLPFKHSAVYLDRAAQFSTSVSNAAVYALGAISQRSATCMFEIEQSSLSNEAKDHGKTLIFSEVQELIKHSTRATDRMYAAMDLFQAILCVDPFAEQQGTYKIKKSSSDSEATPHASSAKNWTCTMARVLLSAATSAVIGLAVAYSCGPAGFDLALGWNDGNGMCGQIIDIIERSQAMANITGEFYWSKLHDIDQRYQDLETVSEAHGLRIDNLVAALGPPNMEGTYFPSAPPPNHHLPNDIKSFIRKASDHSDRQAKKLHDEMEQMRKNFLRMDIRLTKRLDQISRNA
ncbi:hypothetical protein P153DRAFT_354996 [Dothidotthia symphoricarpi CBS 119687]|uniref:Heme haloperoxidase family profile domain-containing protein n=1 Tax=Dothidotthia symphoricarpi CBS 119687 TaxID=1392245 RepID=A0A6A6AMI1_9PLEO|nr:uncharacterized protein P153DRAFT_354996 [Dothidotthia symphoricarpi CBS 119687]KAF2132383.1 hypothetical protein P153DRAFT_354996 [Dothidotthia symphoricarpi CBS 119687]